MNVRTADGAADITRVLELGVDGVITNTAAPGVMARTAYCDAYVCPGDAGTAPGMDAGIGGGGGGGGGGGAVPASGTTPSVALIALAALARVQRRSRARSGRART